MFMAASCTTLFPDNHNSASETIVSDHFNRRMFLRCAAVGPIGVAPNFAIQSQPPPALAQSPIRRAGGAWLKTSLNAYSFSKPLNDAAKMRGPGMSLFDLLDYCAEQNFDAVDPTGYFFPGY